MGYTVYFEQSRPFTMQEWGDIRAACIPMFNRLKQIKGPSGTGRPEIGNDAIRFNGDASKGEDHESFILEREGNGFQFCKTARKPYDRYVKAVLVVANMIAPGALDISCDGDNEDGCWDEGVSIANQYLKIPGRSACSPLEAKRFAKMTESAIAASESFKSCNPSHSDPYKGVYKELDDTIKRLEDLATFVDHKPMKFLVNYLKANIDDLKDAYTP